MIRDTGYHPPRRSPGDAGRAIGLMSGTSMDGIDGVLLALQGSAPITIEATSHLPFPADVREQLSAVITEAAVSVAQLGRLHSQLGELYARAASQLIPDSGEAVAVIGCHGQTIHHQPDGEFPFTLQLGNGALIARRTGIPVVTDFRSADMAAGGQGAPLAPAFHPGRTAGAGLSPHGVRKE